MTDEKPTSAAGAMRALYRKLMQARVQQGISLSEMARRIGITRQSLTAWETGKAWPTLENLFRWAKLLGFWIVLEPIADHGLEVEPRLTHDSGLMDFFRQQKTPEEALVKGAIQAAGEVILDALVPPTHTLEIADFVRGVEKMKADAMRHPPEMLSAGPPLSDLGPHIADLKRQEAALAEGAPKPKRARKPK
jgi:transcriptional regulator with XRE-family HTH domain